jgi:hypothetical protein
MMPQTTAAEAPGRPERRRRASRWRVRPIEALESRVALNASPAATADLVARSATASAVATAEAGSPAATLPKHVDLSGVFHRDRRAFHAVPYLQSFNDCGPNTIAAAVDYVILTTPSLAPLATQGYLPSRLFLYYNSRFLRNGQVGRNEGTYTRLTLATAEAQGMASEGPTTSTPTGAVFRYATSGRNPAPYQVNPGAANYVTGRRYQVSGVTPVFEGAQTRANYPARLLAMKTVLAQGRPFIFWIDVSSNLTTSPPEGSPPDAIPTVDLPTEPVVDPRGHFMLALGYSDARDAFLVLNSWGNEWGKGGLAYLPYAFFKNPKWAKPQYTIDGVTASDAPAPSIGTLDRLTARPGDDSVAGQLHIDPALAGAAGAGASASSFDFFNEGKPNRYVTPLLFSYDSQADTYTLSAIGRPYQTDRAVEAEGFPFDAVVGTAEVAANTAFGFFDGKVSTAQSSVEAATPGPGAVPFSVTTDAAGAWLSTASAVPRALAIGETFSATNARAQVALAPELSNRAYSAMLNE